MIIVVCAEETLAQTPNRLIPFSHQYYQKLNTSVYDTANKFHSSIKGYYSDDSILSQRYSYLMNQGVDTINKRSWVKRKLFEEHLVNITHDDYTAFIDFLPDLQIGRDWKNGNNTTLNTRGLQTGINVGDKFSIYANLFENQGKFPGYITQFIDSNQVVPGQSGGKFDNTTKDWNYTSVLLSYTPSRFLNFTLGYDKNFIGDGYRSMLLSDVASNYSFLRVRATLGSVQYQTIFGYMFDPGAPRLTLDRRLGYRGKWAAIHYLDWNINKRLSLGFFQAVTWADAEPEGKRGFDFNYVHPFAFLRSIESANTLSSPDKMRLGLNLKYEVLANTAFYGQFMFDEFVAREFFKGNGFWTNKLAAQLGVRGSNLANIPNLNCLVEFNMARPYTYAHFDRVSNYAHYNQPLAHPYGANFREFLSIVNYSYKRFDFQGNVSYARYGVDPNGLNYGKDIFKSYFSHVSEYGNYIGQGIGTDLYFAEGKIAFLMNAKYNLRFELGGVLRKETSAIATTSTAWLTIGLRSSFRNLYNDF
ncbi:gliding motility protein RemB [Pedobacter frigoris]|uniref:gliding motility protein RemB n=1 Tax=Pedobacter frigoris TaxID=2571272 RepID=UPI0029315867|nr:gliding motility protein RemB [Pedobacter frigoris]